MRGTSLAQLVNMLKAEVGFNQAQGVAMDTEFQTLLANKQKWLSSKWDWPFLQVRADVGVGPGARYVNVPNLNWERPVQSEVQWSNIWQDVEYGITSEQFNYLDSDQGQQLDPVMRWTFAGQLEVAPPASAPTLGIGPTGVLNGAYSYVVTYVNQFGETTQGPVSATISGVAINNKQIALTNIPIAPQGVVEGVAYPEVTARNLYRTVAGGSSYFLVTSINDNVTTTYNDNIADANLGVAPPIYSNAEATVMEIWPLPVSQQKLRFTGQRVLNPLVALTDTADLDDMLLVLYVAAELLQRRKSADAGTKLQAAQAQLVAVRSNYPRRYQTVNLGGCPEGEKLKIVPFRIVAVH